MSNHLNHFRRDYLNANSWEQRKDGVPLYLLDKLTPEERSIAEQELIEVAGTGDTWPILGLAHLKSTAALPTLHRLLGKSGRSMRITMAYAIFQISRDPEMVDLVLTEAPRLKDWQELIDLMYLLADFKDERVTALLHQFREHKEYLVAYNAARALGLPTEDVVVKFRNEQIARNIAAREAAANKEIVPEKTSWWQKLFGD